MFAVISSSLQCQEEFSPILKNHSHRIMTTAKAETHRELCQKRTRIKKKKKKNGFPSLANDDTRCG